MRTQVITIIFSLVSGFVFSQCKEIDKIKFGGTFMEPKTDYEIDSREYFFGADTTKFCCDIKRIQKYSDFILLESKKHIVERTSQVFYEKLLFKDLTVFYHDYDKIFTTEEKLYDIANCGKITYWVTYEFQLESKVRYGFGLEFDEKGKLISEEKLPDFRTNPSADKIDNPCGAISKVITDKRFEEKDIESVSLVYNKENNSFSWLIKEDGEKEVINREDFEFEKLYDYSSLWFYVNTDTNIIEKVDSIKSSGIFCGLGKPKKKK